MDSFSELPHNNKAFWEKVKGKLKIIPNNIKELNTLFFDGKCKFFDILEKRHIEEGEEFFKVYQYLQNLALNLEKELPETIPILKKNTKGKYELTRRQVGLLFFLSFFNLIDLKQEKGLKNKRFIVFQLLLSLTETKFEFGRCFLNYLTIIGKWLSENNIILDEKIKYIRDSHKLEFKKLDRGIKLCEIQIYEQGSLFSGKSSYFIDFANKYIGGGVLVGGCVQEEILFAIAPEAIISMFFMEVMSENDAIRIDNIIQFSNFIGYGNKFKFNGCAIENININQIKKHKIIAIDACIQETDFFGNIDKKEIKRDIRKAFVGFNLVNFEKEKNEEKSIATGNWGCGAFGGDHELKFLQQWIAASFAGIERLDYYTFGENEMQYIIKKIDSIKLKYNEAFKLYEKLITKKLSSGKVAKNIYKDYHNENGNNICFCSII